MGYYDKLIEEWGKISGDLSTEDKLAAINAMTVPTPPKPVVIPTYEIYNMADIAEVDALDAPKRSDFQELISMGTVDASPNTKVRDRIVAIFGSSPNTIATLAAFAEPYDNPPARPWWSVPWEEGGGGLSHEAGQG